MRSQMLQQRICQIFTSWPGSVKTLKSIVDILARILNRRSLWRLGRYLYRIARADSPGMMNNMRSNGEEMIQTQFLSKFAESNEPCVIFDVGAYIGEWSLSILDKSAGLKIE